MFLHILSILDKTAYFSLFICSLCTFLNFYVYLIFSKQTVCFLLIFTILFLIMYHIVTIPYDNHIVAILTIILMEHI